MKVLGLNIPNPLSPVNSFFGIGTQAPSAQQAWIDAGGPQDQARIAAAVMKAESHCDNHADNHVCCVCAMQINVKAHTQYDGSKLKSNLDECMKAAVEVFQSQGWAAWQAYTDGTYKKYLGSDCEVKNAYKPGYAHTVGGRQTVLGSPTVADPLAEVANFLRTLAQASTWFRVGKVLLGALLILILTALLIKG